MNESPEPVSTVVSRVLPGYIVIYSDNRQLPKGISVYLTTAFHDWVVENPQYKVRASVGIVDQGETVMYHVWYDGEVTHEG